MKQTENKEFELHGIPASPGICIGRVIIAENNKNNFIRHYNITESGVAAEKNRFNAAIQKSRKELMNIIENTPEELKEQANIMETHVGLLDDKMFYGKTLEIIEKDLVNAEWALRTVVDQLKLMFKTVEDEYFKERVSDIMHIFNRVTRNLVGGEQFSIKNVTERGILVVSDLSPAETSQLQLEYIMGFITDLGGKTSHTGIIARTLEIPAVLGTQNASQLLHQGDLVIVDGSKGIIIANPEEQTLQNFVQRRIDYEIYRAEIIRSSKEPTITLDGVEFKVLGNIEMPEEVVSVKDKGGDGIGLYRTEFQYMNRANFPGEFDLYDKYKDVVDVISPLPVTIRTLDINGDKVVSYSSHYVEPNPALGLRAIRYCLKKPLIFMTQLRAILRVACHGDVRLLLPMISIYEELIEAKRFINKAADELAKEGIDHNPDISIGIMIEVPSAVMIADYLAQEVDFFSIGTNDLIQYSLAIDRGNAMVAGLFNPLHPPVIRMIKQVADITKKTGIKLYMCGEMAADPLHVPLLIGLGIEEFSMNPQSIPFVKRMIRNISMPQCEEIARQALTKKTSAEVQDMIQSQLGSLLTDYEW